MGCVTAPHFLKHFTEFLLQYDDSYVREFGYFRSIIPEVVQGYLKCGDLAEGFARVRCPDCHHEFLLAFSCRGRWFCPSCHAMKVVQFGLWEEKTPLESAPPDSIREKSSEPFVNG